MEYAVELSDVKFAYTPSVPVLDIPTLYQTRGQSICVWPKWQWQDDLTGASDGYFAGQYG
jgi:hypothetical protein